MQRIGLISDTHSFLDESVFEYFEECDQIWHAGDIGNWEVVEKLADFRPFKAVYGNIDGGEFRQSFPEYLVFEEEGIKILMIHIGGYPKRYKASVQKMIEATKPRLYICGHSHILKVMHDSKYNLLHINPGAAGNYGFHKIRTIVRFTLEEGAIKDLEVIELGKRGG